MSEPRRCFYCNADIPNFPVKGVYWSSTFQDYYIERKCPSCPMDNREYYYREYLERKKGECKGQ